MQTYNIEPHGLFYSDVTHLKPGEQHTYIWTVPESVAPTDFDDDCVTYLYTSTVDQVKDTNSGLVGPLLVCKEGTMENQVLQSNYYLLFTVFDENESHYLDENINRFTFVSDSVDKEDEDFKESNLMHSINGLMYGNLREINLCLYTDNYIHMMGLGNEVDMHSMVISGQNIKYRNENTGVLGVFPHTTATTVVTPEDSVTDKIICRTNDHLLGGMVTLYTAMECDGQEQDNRGDGLFYWSPPETQHEPDVTRTYFIGAVEEIWDYFPAGQDALGNPVMEGDDLHVFINQEEGKFIGHKYLKALFYEYTDETFTNKKEKRADLGMLGPVISAEEGDLIRVVFKNMASRRYSIANWGAVEPIHARNLSAGPGEKVTYTWLVPSSAAPEPNQPECNTFMYVSSVDSVKDIYSGLVGPLMICRKGTLQNGSNRFADREYFLLFLVSDENSAHYIDNNIRKFAGVDPASINKGDDDFKESNLMHGINGRLEHLDGLEMYDGERVIWYLMGLGTEVDLHTVHFHAHAFIHTSDIVQHEDVFNIYPGRIATFEMNVNAVGSWLLHCHVNDHMSAGMRTTYTVLQKKEPKPSCYIKNRRNRRALSCAFNDLDSVLKFLSQTSRIQVCLHDIEQCQDEIFVNLGRILSLELTYEFPISHSTLHRIVHVFPRLRNLHFGQRWNFQVKTAKKRLQHIDSRAKVLQFLETISNGDDAP